MTVITAPQASQTFWNRIRKNPVAPFLVAAGYYLGAQAAFLIGTLSDKIFAPFWPPNTILFCALLTSPVRRWWIFILAVFPMHAAAEIGVGMNAGQLLVAFATNVAVALLNAIALRSLVENPLGTLRGTCLYVLITGLASPALVALAGAFVPIAGGANTARYWQYWVEWYASNALGSLTLGPPILIVMNLGKRFFLNYPRARMAEAALLIALLVIVSMIAFASRPSTFAEGFFPSLIYLPIPLIIYAALRFGSKGASFAVLVVTVVLVCHSLNSSSPFASGDIETSVFALQTFLIGLAAPMLLLGAAIEETRTADRTTRETEERMVFAAASAHTGLWEYNIEASRFWATEFCRTLFGLRAAVRTSRDALLSMVHPDDRAIATAAINTDLTPGLPSLSEFRLLLPGGNIRWIQSTARIFHDENGAPLRIGGIFSDITQRKEDQIEAEQRRRDIVHLTRVSMLGELSGAIAHEINQPLTAILSNAQAVRLMLSHPSPDLQAAVEALEDIVKEDTRASEVITRLRGLLKKGEIKFEFIDVNKLIEQVLELLHSEIISRRTKLNLELAENLPPIQGDPVQLQQVILNLLMNAMEAMTSTAAHERIVTITTLLVDSATIEITIADRGDGIAPEHHGRLGEPFFTTKRHGLGLGLSLCSTIVKSHGGDLQVVNNNDEGAKATITLMTETARVQGVAI